MPRFVVDRRFWVREGKRVEFGEVFGPDGFWARFLGKAQGYVATEVNCESVVEGKYRVRDFWSGHRWFERFRERSSEEIAGFDREMLDRLFERQEFVGAYYESDDDSGFELESTS